MKVIVCFIERASRYQSNPGQSNQDFAGWDKLSTSLGKTKEMRVKMNKTEKVT